jgi:hypothetical protein
MRSKNAFRVFLFLLIASLYSVISIDNIQFYKELGLGYLPLISWSLLFLSIITIQTLFCINHHWFGSKARSMKKHIEWYFIALHSLLIVCSLFDFTQADICKYVLLAIQVLQIPFFAFTVKFLDRIISELN